MLKQLLPYLNWTQLFVLLAFLWAVAALPRTKKNRVVLAILFICFVNELLSLLFLLWHINNALLFTINFILHNGLWLWLILKTKYRNKIIAAFLTLAALNLLFVEGQQNFNYNTFILGAFLYLTAYLIMSFTFLNREHFAFFYSNEFIILSAPVLFFFGLSFIFAFRSDAVSATIVFGTTSLYTFIGFFINVVYYALICLYAFKERRHATV